MLDQEVVVIDQFKGLYDRGEIRDLNVTQIQPGFFKTLNNFYHQGESLVTRPGQIVTTAFSGEKLIRFWPYRKSDATDQFIAMYLVAGGLTQNIKDSGGGTALNSITLGNDFQIFVLRDKAIGGEVALNAALQQPLGTGNLRIYRLDGNAFRDAAGLSPSAAGAIAAANGAAGKVETGVHLIAVAYETNTGFITPPGVFVGGVYTPTQYNAPGALKINLTNIPTGPAGTVARHILVSKIIRFPFNGDVLIPELFFCPGGKIADNVTTILTVDFYDSELQISADYLLDELEVIPAGTCYCIYRNRLISVGFSPTGTSPIVDGFSVVPCYIARVSNPGAFESFSSIEGFIQVAVNDGDALQACWELNGNLYFAKGSRTYVTRDNGGPPNTWEVSLVDASIGCGPWGVARIDNTQNNLIEGGVIVGGRRGVYFFTGQYPSTPLTYNIEALYRRNITDLASYDSFFYSKFCYDSYRRMLYCLPGAGANYLMVASCDNGLNPQEIRWSIFNNFATSSVSSRVITDICTAALSPTTNYLNTILFMVFTDATSGADASIWAMKTTYSLDNNSTRISWDLVTFPVEVDELDKLQVIGARALMKHNNDDNPIDFNFGAFDYTYGEFTETVPQFFGDSEFPPIRDMVLIPQLYDAPINLRSKLVGLALSRGIRGGNITTSIVIGDITNTVFVHRLMLFGNRIVQGKAQGSIR